MSQSRNNEGQKLVRAFPPHIMFQPRAWAKIQWFLDHAEGLEVGGFGVSASSSSLLQVKDFQILLQMVDKTNTEFDNEALGQYVTRMAMKKIAPAECARIWIHFHPFAKHPSPSSQDDDTFREKICDNWNVDWGVMVIVGTESTYCELFMKSQALNGYVRMQIPAVVDWYADIWDKHDEEWEKEYEKNVIEIVPEPPKKAKSLAQHSMHQPVIDDKAFRDWNISWTIAEEERWIKEHRKTGTVLSQLQWIWGRAEGYTPDELIKWGYLCVYNRPEVLRQAERKTGLKHAKQIEKIQKRKQTSGKKKKKNKKNKGN